MFKYLSSTRSLKRLYKLILNTSSDKSSGNASRVPSTVKKYPSQEGNHSDNNKEDSHKGHIIAVISQEFDPEYYLTSYPDVAAAKFNPIDHWLEYGWKERRNPNQHFNTDNYLLANKDVAEANIDPFYHYLAAGRAENRPLTVDTDTIIPPGPEDNSDKSIQDRLFEYETIKKEFDSDFYLTMYPDISEYPYEPIWHFIDHGWKENRNPTPNFNTAFYLSDNPDVVKAGINPFYHYIVAGKNERRYTSQPGGDTALTIYNLKSKNEITHAWVRPDPDTSITEHELHSKLEFSLKSKNIISFSHDAYLNNTGGVQLCIGIEQNNSKLAGICYIHIAPYQPLPFLSDNQDTDRFYYEISIDGSYLGVVKHTVLYNILSIVSPTFDIIIHALHGHSPFCIENLLSAIKIRKAFIWIHDYFTICEGYNLLRNNASFCNAPPPDSQGCNICIYGDERKQHLNHIEKLLTKYSMNVISPSTFALNLWKNKSKINPHFSEVIEHIELTTPTKREGVDKSGLIRIGFVGYPSFHKGWGDFSILVRHFLSNPRYEFYHFAKIDNKALPINFIESNTDAHNILATSQAIRNSDIDLVYVPACWPETFNLTCYEAIAAGAKIITHSSSGNVAELVSKVDHGIVVKNVKELITILESQLPSSLTTNRSYYNIKHSRMTLDSKEFNK